MAENISSSDLEDVLTAAGGQSESSTTDPSTQTDPRSSSPGSRATSSPPPAPAPQPQGGQEAEVLLQRQARQVADLQEALLAAQAVQARDRAEQAALQIQQAAQLQVQANQIRNLTAELTRAAKPRVGQAPPAGPGPPPPSASGPPRPSANDPPLPPGLKPNAPPDGDWEDQTRRLQITADKTRGPGQQDALSRPGPGETNPVLRDMKAFSTATSSTPTGRLGRALADLQAATFQLQNSEQAGPHLLSSRTNQVKTCLSRARDCYTDLGRGPAGDEEMANEYMDSFEEVQTQANFALDEAAILMDRLDIDKEQRKEQLSTRPKMTLEVFQGETTDWQRFHRDALMLKGLYNDNQPQGLNVLMQYCSQKIKSSMRQFSGRDDAIDLALAHLAVQYGVAHLSIPAVKDQIKQIRPANVMAHIPPTCSRILQLLESLGGMMPKENSLDPSLVHEILKKLHYSQHELSSETTVKLLQSEEVSLSQITELVRQRFQTYELIRRTVLKDSAPPHTQAAFGMDGTQPAAGRGRGRGRGGAGRGGAGRGGAGRGHSRDQKPGGDRSEGQTSRKDPVCPFCKSKNLDSGHFLTKCPTLGPAHRQAFRKLGRCSDCLMERKEGHICKRTHQGSDKVKLVFCSACNSNVMFCTNPDSHARVEIPETTSGMMVSAAPAGHRPEGAPGSLIQQEPSARERPQGSINRGVPDSLGLAASHAKVRGKGMQMLHAIEGKTESVNRGALGRPASLYTVMTFMKGNQRVKVNCLIDGGSESSFYSPAIETLAIASKPRHFKIENLSMGEEETPVHKGVQATFTIETGGRGGQQLRIDLLQHSGLFKRKMRTRSKLLTVSDEFAIKHKLEEKGIVTSTQENILGQNKVALLEGAPLTVILGQDLFHLHPALVDSLVDIHGRVDLHYCALADKLLVSGNRHWPLEEDDIDYMIQEAPIQGCFAQVGENQNEESAPCTALMAAAVEAGSQLPMARVATQVPALHYPGNPVPENTSIGSGEDQSDEEDDEQVEQDHVRQQARAASAKDLLETGVLSRDLHIKLEKFAYTAPAPEHRLQPGCLTCKTCKICVESSNGESHYLKIATQGFAEHCMRVPLNPAGEEADPHSPSHYYQIKYLKLPGAPAPRLNLLEAFTRHCSLRKTLQALPTEAQQEFGEKLTRGLQAHYWEIVSEFDVLKHLRQEQTSRAAGDVHRNSQVGGRNLPTHFLPAGIVLKEDAQANTKARLILDPSRSFNKTLIPPPSKLEKPIAQVLRKIQGMAIFAFLDIKEAFWKQRLDNGSSDSLCFLMDISPAGQLTASDDEGNRLVCLRPKRSIMGVSQSPVFLSLAKLDMAKQLESVDPVLAEQLRTCSYVDDLGAACAQEEIDLAKENYEPDFQACPDPTCCKEQQSDPRVRAETPSSPPEERFLPPRPQDEQRASRHLLRGAVGQVLTHSLALRVARLESQLRSCDMSTRGATSNLEAVVCPFYFNKLVNHYTDMIDEGKQPCMNDMKTVQLPEGYEHCRPDRYQWFKPWVHSGPDEPKMRADPKEDAILRVLGPPDERQVSAEETKSIAEEGSSSLLGYAWSPEKDLLSTNKLKFINILPARRGLRPLAGRLYRPGDLMKLHKARPKGLTLRHCLSAAHALFDPLNIAPWASIQMKFCYRLCIIDSPPKEGYKSRLSDQFVKNHLTPGIATLLLAKRCLAQQRSWRLPPCIDQATVQAELPVLADGAYGVLSASAALAYLVQRYSFNNEDRVSVYLLGASSALSPMNRPFHQVSAELAALDLGQKEADKGKRILAEAGINVHPHLVSDSETALTICTKQSVQLELGPGLIVSRIQQTFGYRKMFHTAGANFAQNVDLMTRYRPNLHELISEEFYAPTFLKRPIKEQPLVPVAEMVKVMDPHLPFLCRKQMVFVHLGTKDQQPALLSKESDPGRGLSSTGTGWRSHPPCRQPCHTCGSGQASHQRDDTVLMEAKEKEKKPSQPPGSILPPLSSVAGGGSALGALGMNVESALKPHRRRRVAKSARSGLRPPRRRHLDSNPFKELLPRRWGYSRAARAIAMCIKWIPARRQKDPPLDRALKSLFQGERDNSYRLAAEGRRGNNTFDLEEIEGIICVRGRDLDPGEANMPLSILAQEKHRIFDQQLTAYLVPLVYAGTALGIAVIQQIHLENCGESAASTAARISRYFYLVGPVLPICQRVTEACARCRRIRAVRGKDKIRRMRYLGPSDMTEGSSLLTDISGPFEVFIEERKVDAARTRSVTTGKRRMKVKRWILMACCPFSHRLEVSQMESISTQAVIGALQEIMCIAGWKTQRLALDPGSSLAPGAAQAMSARADDLPDLPDEDDEEVAAGARQKLVHGLRQQGYDIRPTHAKASWRQAQVEATNGAFKKILYSSLLPGSADLTVASFGRCIRMCAALVNNRPVVLLPAGAQHPGEGMLCSPAALKGPSHAHWAECAAVQDARGQYAIVQHLEARFRKNWLIYYARRLRSNSKLGNVGENWEAGSTVLIMDLPAKSGRIHPHPRLGIIKSFLDAEKTQAAIEYVGAGGNKQMLDRPVGNLVMLVRNNEPIPTDGFLFDPLIQQDEAILQSLKEEAKPAGAVPPPPAAPSPGHEAQAAPGHLQAAAGHLQAAPGHLQAAPGHLQAAPGHLKATPGHSRRPVAAPSSQPETQAAPGRPVSRGGEPRRSPRERRRPARFQQ